jgi:hypothetical protein
LNTLWSHGRIANEAHFQFQLLEGVMSEQEKSMKTFEDFPEEQSITRVREAGFFFSMFGFAVMSVNGWDLLKLVWPHLIDVHKVPAEPLTFVSFEVTYMLCTLLGGIISLSGFTLLLLSFEQEGFFSPGVPDKRGDVSSSYTLYTSILGFLCVGMCIIAVLVKKELLLQFSVATFSFLALVAALGYFITVRSYKKELEAKEVIEVPAKE